MSFNLTTSGACLIKAGANANNLFAISGAFIAKLGTFCDQAEADLCLLTRRDWVALSGATTTNFRGILDDVVSDMVAMKVISYDMSGYTSLLEAATMLDVMRDNITRNLGELKWEKNQEKML